MIPVGDTIKRLRSERGMTQGALAENLGVQRSTVASWENNTRVPQTDTARKIASLFHVPLSLIVPAGNEPKQYVSISRRLEDLIDKYNESYDDELAKDIGVDFSDLRNWVEGNSTPSFDEIVKLAAYFNVTVDTIRGETKDIISINPMLPDVNALTASCPELIDVLFLWPKLTADQRQQIAGLIKSIASSAK